ncbi:MAG: NAD(P)H-dependent oxidoreductase subunit E [Pseudomonadota bacterium]
MKLETVENIVNRYKDQKGSIIAILEDIQSTFSYLPADALKAVARMTGQSLVDIYGVATFYKSFSLKPRGRHVCSVCVGTACHVRGSQGVADELEAKLGIKAGETTADREYSLEKVACLGACALGPITVVDHHYFSKVQPRDAAKILARTREGLDRVEVKTDQRIFPVDVSCARCNHSLMDARRQVDGYPSIYVVAAFERVHTWVRLSCLYGSYTVESEHDIPQDTVVQFFCPHCHAELSSASTCTDCGAPVVPMIVRQGGIVQICSRRGCRGHLLDLDGVNL